MSAGSLMLELSQYVTHWHSEIYPLIVPSRPFGTQCGDKIPLEY